MGVSEEIRSRLNGEEKPETALETDYDTSETYSSKDAQYHMGLGAGAVLSGLSAISYHSFSSGRYFLGATSLGVAAVGGSLTAGMAFRSYLKLAGKSGVKLYNAVSGDSNSKNLFEEMKED